MKPKTVNILLLLLSPIFLFSFMKFDCTGCDKVTSVTPITPTNAGLCIASTDGGTTWDTLLTENEANILWAVHIPRFYENTILCAGADQNYGETTFRTTDAGISWTNTSVPNYYYDIASFSAAYNYNWRVTLAVGIGKILKSTNGGESWAQINNPATKTLRGVAFYPGATGGGGNEVTALAVGNVGTIIRTTDKGETWTSIASGTTSNLKDVCAFYPKDLLTFQDTAVVVGDNGTVLITTDFGLNWVQSPFSPNANFYTVAFSRLSSSGRFGLMGGLHLNQGAIIYKTTDGGVTWTQKTLPGINEVKDICINPVTGNIFAVSRYCVIRSVDNGETWTKVLTYQTGFTTFNACYSGFLLSEIVIAVGN